MVSDAGPAGDSDCRVQLVKSALVTWAEIRKHRSIGMTWTQGGVLGRAESSLQCYTFRLYS